MVLINILIQVINKIHIVQHFKIILKKVCILFLLNYNGLIKSIPLYSMYMEYKKYKFNKLNMKLHLSLKKI